MASSLTRKAMGTYSTSPAKTKLHGVLIREICVGRRCCAHSPHQGRPPAPYHLFRQSLHTVRLNHQPKEDKHHGPRRQQHPSNYHRGLQPGGGGKLFTYLCSTISSNLSLDAKLNTRIDKTSTAMACLAKRMWDNTVLTLNMKTKVYQACILSTLRYGSEAWTLYSQQEQLNAFHMGCLRQLLGITW